MGEIAETNIHYSDKTAGNILFEKLEVDSFLHQKNRFLHSFHYDYANKNH
ncbi:hypothetical protein BTJ44_05656 [Bacillus mycoides]|nr:hypothetical protein BTJ44_05656 [Bacillus mycoides]OSY08197.1 hypothetical protein BTJ48_03150 [Bacillus mycoides]